MNWKTELLIVLGTLGMCGSFMGFGITQNYLFIPTTLIASFGLAWGFARKFIFEDEPPRSTSKQPVNGDVEH